MELQDILLASINGYKLLIDKNVQLVREDGVGNRTIYKNSEGVTYTFDPLYFNKDEKNNITINTDTLATKEELNTKQDEMEVVIIEAKYENDYFNYENNKIYRFDRKLKNQRFSIEYTDGYSEDAYGVIEFVVDIESDFVEMGAGGEASWNDSESRLKSDFEAGKEYRIIFAGRTLYVDKGVQHYD